MSTASPAAPVVRARRLPPLWAVLAGALLLRLAVLALTPDYALFGDANDYDFHARHLVDHGSYPPSTFAAPGSPSALRPPGYPYLLAGLYEVFGGHTGVGRVAGALLGTATVWLTHGVTRRVWDERTAIWAAAVTAAFPTLVVLSGGLVAETLFVPLLMAAVLAVLCHRDAGGGVRWAFLAGALIGLAVLTRSNGAIVVLPLLVAAWLPRRRWVDPVVLLVGVALVMTPWTVRNAAVLDTFAPLGTQSGFTAAGVWNTASNVPGDRKGAWFGPFSAPETRALLQRPGTDEAGVDADLRHQALTYAGDHPGFALVATGYHAFQLFQVWPYVGAVSGLSFREQGLPHWTWAPLQLVLWPFLVLAAAGAVLLARRRGRRGPAWLWAVPLLVVLSVVPLLGPPRYRVPVDPFLAMLVAVALIAAVDRRRARRAGAGAA